MKFIALIVFGLMTAILKGQSAGDPLEQPPVFTNCKSLTGDALEACFFDELSHFVAQNLELPDVVVADNYKGKLILFFEVNAQGEFVLQNTEAVYPELKTAAKALFEKLPKILPATYSGKPIALNYKMPIAIPLTTQEMQSESTLAQELLALQKTEYDQIINLPFKKNQKYKSQLIIPFSHEVYSRFDGSMQVVGNNAHTSSKPLLFSDVAPYYSFENELQNIEKPVSGWWGRKWWNEHMVQVQGENYWFTIDPGADLQLGKESEESDFNFTYNNTRAIIVQGGLGKQLNFYTSFLESQGRFAEYFNDLSRSIKPDGGNPGIVPGRDIGKETRAVGGFDYPVAEAYLSYKPSQYFDMQLGYSKNFIGDGYRSLLQSDSGSPYPFFKLNTRFWKIKYTNTWTALKDVRPEVTNSGSFRTKYMASHYLSYNVTKRLNVGFFEAAIWENDNGQGFDVSYLNPIIFYQAVQFSLGSRGGNSLIGLSGKYKFSDQINAYGQWVIDEFSGADVFGGNESYKNKLGFQLGVKYFDAFKIPGLILQAEINQVRPYVYSNNEVQLNYGHKNQSLGHPWGANFRELIAIARYRHQRWYGTAKLIYGRRGLEPQDTEFDFGGSIYSNDEVRPSDTAPFFQGNEATTFYAEAEIGYLINPSTNLKAYVQPIYRTINVAENNAVDFDRSTLWFNLGFRTDLFNWYYDY